MSIIVNYDVDNPKFMNSYFLESLNKDVLKSRDFIRHSIQYDNMTVDKLDYSNLNNILVNYFTNKKDCKLVNVSWLNTFEILNNLDIISSKDLVFLYDELTGHNLSSVNCYCVNKNIEYFWLAYSSDKSDLYKNYQKNFIIGTNTNIIKQTSNKVVNVFMCNMNIDKVKSVADVVKEVVLGYKILSRTGNIVFRISEISSKFVVSFILLTRFLFKSLTILETTNSFDIYIIGKSFYGLTSYMSNYLDKILEQVDNLSIDELLEYGFCDDTNLNVELNYYINNVLNIKRRKIINYIDDIQSMKIAISYLKNNNVSKISKLKQFKMVDGKVSGRQNFDQNIINTSISLKTPLNYKFIKIVDESIYSSPLPYHIKNILSSYDTNLPKDIHTIVDLTSHVGIDALLLSYYFNSEKLDITLVEKNETTSKVLEENFTNINNIFIDKEFNGKFSVKNMSAIDYIEKDLATIPNKLDLVYVDPPWGGIDYKSKDSLKLFLDKVDVVELIVKILPKFKYIVFKIPYNYDIDNLNLKLKDITGFINIVDIFKSGRVSYRLVFIQSLLD
jgi:hypothetical protein